MTSSIRVPQQTRSRRTMDRFVLAAVRLLEERDWRNVGVAELASAAEASVGAFYARFEDKQALLDYLDERYAEEFIALLRAHVAQASARGWSLEDRTRRLMRRLVRFFSRYRGVLRTLVMAARSGDSASFRARTERMNAEMPALVESFRESPGAAPVSRAEVRQALAFTFSAMRDQILFPQSIPAGAGPGAAALVRALERNFLGFLGYRRSAGP